jgi:Zn-dependent M28 family amino/carboxypeptidase
VPVITVSAAVVAAIFEGEKVSGAEIFRRAQERKGGDAFALADAKRLVMRIGAHVEALRTQNVVAIHEGSDPALRSEYVAIGAHYDHVGVARTGADRIFNGADDDGSGTTAILAIAEALARGAVKTKRSVLLVWHAGEERGLLGSRYFVTRPTVPLGQIAAMLNIDMIGRSRPAGDTTTANASLTGPQEIYVIGSKMMSSTLGELSERVNRGYLNLKFNYKYDDPNDSSRFFFRSDHYNYARQGIPIVFYFSGVHADYHRVSDEVATIDFAKMEKVTRTIYATALALADAPARPAVDRKLPAQLTEP